MQYSGGPEAKTKHHTGKRKRKVTACPDQRRAYGHCGICGSGNVAGQGVKYCERCGSEAEYLTQDVGWYVHTSVDPPCKCLDSWTYTVKGGKTVTRHRRPTRTIGVEKCLDCGAVRSTFCPNTRGHDCWHHWDGRTYCPACGFTCPAHGFVRH